MFGVRPGIKVHKMIPEEEAADIKALEEEEAAAEDEPTF
jgi:hypothetical protein